MFSQEGIALRLEQTWALITQQVLQVGARGDQRGVDIISARGGGSHSPSLSPLASSQTSSLLTVFFFRFFFFVFLYLLASQSLLPTSLSCWIVEFSLNPCPRSLRVRGGVAASSQLGTSFHHLVVGSILSSYFSSHLPSLGGKVATGNWPRICLPQFSNSLSPVSPCLSPCLLHPTSGS